MQNDFIHAWGLDKNLGYCVQVLYLIDNMLFMFVVNSVKQFARLNLFLCIYREISPGKSELWMINMLCTTAYLL
jgi:hypothetical protein